MTKRMKLDGDFNFQTLARFTPGYVGADIRSLIREAAALAIQRIFRDVLKGKKLLSDLTPDEEEGDEKPAPTLEPLTDTEMEPLFVTMQDFMDAIPHVQPSSKREGFATVPDVSWDEIGALGSTREELTLSILEPIRNPEKFKALGIPLPAGVMLYGPPGCGKTLLAKAIANESGANFISVKGPELLDKYVGESERSVRLVFERARASSPCVVFFDELDSLCRKRGSDDGGGSGVSERVVNQLLTEMDGLESRRSVFVIAATNRPELIDPAMMRPGRLDKLLYVPLPTPNDRVSILKAISGKVNLGPDVDLDTIGRSARADGYSGADCAALLREAGLAVLKEEMSASANAMDTEEEEGEERNICITARHFDYAFDHVVPSVSRKDQARYNRMRDRMAHARSRGAVVEETALEDVKEDAAVKEENVKASSGGENEKPIEV
uniref:Host cell division cycle protein n=1 Tax=Nitzschia sp. IriIs04 TaxID=1444690 RepID=A0A0P0YV27_9STRA|nr:host cell division cycle protein [Nitzschia sp. IriIs04]